MEIASLRAQLQAKEVPKDSSRRLSRREEQNLSQYRCVSRLNTGVGVDLGGSPLTKPSLLSPSDRIRDLSSLILTSQRIEEEEEARARPVSPTKVDFDASLPDVRAPFNPFPSVRADIELLLAPSLSPSSNKNCSPPRSRSTNKQSRSNVSRRNSGLDLRCLPTRPNPRRTSSLPNFKDRSTSTR